MTFLVDIAHPNDIVHAGWQRVDEVENLEDLLNSPTFDWFPGLCVRAVKDHCKVYSGVFSQDACVDVGPRSYALKKWWRRFDRESATQLGPLDLFDRWAHCTNALWLIGGSRDMMTRSRITKVGCACVRDVLKFIPSDEKRALRAVEYAEECAMKNDFSIQECRKLSLHAFNASDWHRSYQASYAARAASTAARLMMEPEQIGACLNECAMASDNYDKAQTDLANTIRDNVPFHEIVEAVVR